MEFNNTSLSKVKKTIIENTAKLDTINILSSFCPKFKTNEEYIVNKAFIISQTLIRHIKRIYYHSSNFIEIINELVPNQIKLMEEFVNPIENDFGFPVYDKIYFEFDAFLYSSKSIVENNIHKKILSNFHSSVLNIYKQLAEQFLHEFVKPVLNKIRNEVVHLNNFGSSLGSMAHAKVNKNSLNIELISNYKINNKNIDLIELFLLVNDRMNYIINILMNIMIDQVYHIWGKPEKKQSMRYGNFVITIPEFEIKYE